MLRIRFLNINLKTSIEYLCKDGWEEEDEDVEKRAMETLEGVM